MVSEVKHVHTPSRRAYACITANALRVNSRFWCLNVQLLLEYNDFGSVVTRVVLSSYYYDVVVFTNLTILTTNLTNFPIQVISFHRKERKERCLEKEKGIKSEKSSLVMLVVKTDHIP